jgi:hypothetical protein
MRSHGSVGRVPSPGACIEGCSRAADRQFIAAKHHFRRGSVLRVRQGREGKRLTRRREDAKESGRCDPQAQEDRRGERWRLGAVGFLPPNANGVASPSPGLAEERGLPWVDVPATPNRNAVVACAATPHGVEIVIGIVPRSEPELLLGTLRTSDLRPR